MLTVVVGALMLGVCLIITSVTALALKASHNHERKSVLRTPITQITSWRPGSARVAAAGQTAYGPAGPFVAPVSGEGCAWFTTSLIRTPSRRFDDSDPVEDVLWRMTTPVPPAFQDATGTVLIDPKILIEPPNLLDPVATKTTMRVYGKQTASTAPRFVPREFVSDVRSNETLRLWETWMPAGQNVYAFGAVSRSGNDLMLRPRSGLTIFTTDSPETVMARRRQEAIDARKLAIFLGRFGLVVTAVSGALAFWLVS